MADAGSILGTRVQRVEDPALLRGRGTFIDNVAPTDALHLTFARSASAHARIREVHVEDAQAAQGVVAVYTAADLDGPGSGPTLPFPLLTQDMPRPLLASEVVRFAGEPVAVVVAETAAAGADAAELIWVDDEPLDVVVDVEVAARDETLLHPTAGTNLCLSEGEPIDADLDGHEVVVSARILNPRMAAVPLEVRTAAARWEGDRLTQWSCNQGAHGARDVLAERFGVDAGQVRVITPDVGGGFGAKNGVTAEELIVPWVSRALGRPVRWTETRSENMVGMTHGRGQVQRAVLAGSRDGKFAAYRLDVLQDAGAYPTIGGILPYMTRLMATGVYDIGDVEVRIRSVCTNTTPVGAFRGAGRPEAAACIERMVDMFAAECGLDPAEVRRTNALDPDAFPLTTPTGAAYDSGAYQAALDAALDAAGYPSLREEQERRRDAGDSRLLGVGMSLYVEVTNVVNDSEYGSVEITADGGAIVRTGSSAHGQGHHTSWAMLVSDRTGIPVERIEVRHGDTDDVARGSGTGGSKSLQIGGAAATAAADLVVERARDLAADVLEANPDDIVLDTGTGSFSVAGTPVTAMSWSELYDAAGERNGGALSAETDFEPGGSTFPFGAHVAVVEVDALTGRVELLRHVACDDAGVIVNPLIVDGQVHGGVAAGIGQALFEEVCYDDDGNPQTANFADYAFPSAAELPSFERVPHETPTHLNPLGAKGIGESGTIGATPAVQNAVVDALRHLDVRHVDLPLRPERVWRAGGSQAVTFDGSGPS